MKYMKVNQKIEKNVVRKGQLYKMHGLINMVFRYEGICVDNQNRVNIIEIFDNKIGESRTIPAGWITKDSITKL